MQLFLFCTQLVCPDCSKLIKCRVNSCKCHSQSYSTKSIRQVSLSEPLSPWDLAPGFADFYATNLPNQYCKCSCKSNENWYVCPFYILIRLFIVSTQNGRSCNSWRFTRPNNQGFDHCSYGNITPRRYVKRLGRKKERIVSKSSGRKLRGPQKRQELDLQNQQRI